MFDLRLLVHDKKLSEVLWALDGLIVGPPMILPVRGGKLIEGEAHAEGDGGVTLINGPKTLKRGGNHKGRPRPTGTRLPEKVLTWLIEKRPERIIGPTFRQAITALGGNPGSFSYVIQWARKKGLLIGPDANKNYKLNMAAVNKRLGGAIQQTPPTGRKPQVPGQPRLPFGESLPGRVARELINEGILTPTQTGIRGAVVAAHGSKGSIFHVIDMLQKAGVLGKKAADGSYTINVAEYKRQMGQE